MDFKIIIENKMTTTKKFEDLEVRILEEDIPTTERFGGDTCGGGIGVRLKAIVSEKDKRDYVLWEGMVRGTGRYGDDFKHWYREISDIKKDGGIVSITLSSEYLQDTYRFDPMARAVSSIKSIDLSELKKIQEMQQLISGEKSHKELLKDFGKAMTKKYSIPGTKEPDLIGTVTDEEQGMGVVLVGLYRKGYDPAMKEIKIYALKDKRFLELESIDLTKYYSPWEVSKDTLTYFDLVSAKLSKGEIPKLEVKGEILSRRWDGHKFPQGVVEESKEIKGQYKSLDEMLR